MKFLWDKAIGFHSNHERGRGGVALLIHLKWESYIDSHGCFECQRVIWVVIKQGESVFGVCNVYS